MRRKASGSDANGDGSSPTVSQRDVIATTARDWWAFWILGTVNNLGYVVVLSGAKSLADSFGDGNLIGVLNWADVAFGLAAKSLNAVVFQGTSFHNRVTINSVFGFLGVLGVALSGRISFAFAVASVTLIGLMSSFGESVLLGFLKYYPSSMAGAWSSGTGMAGVFGSAFYLALHGAGVSNAAIFYTMLPPILLYWAAFVWMLRKPISAPQAADAAPGQSAGPPKTSYSLLNADAVRADDPGDVEVATMAGNSGGSRQRKHNQPNATTDVPSTNVVARTDGAGVVGFARAWRCTRVVAWAGFNLFMVYFAEYVVSVGCAAKANPASFSTSSSWFERNSYAVLAFCYQIGVMCSRSSLSIIRVRRFGLLTVLQLVNLVLWLLQAGYHIVGVWVQFAAMIYVGLIGGAMYVNVFAELVEDPKIEERDRELCINIASIFNNIGIVAASIFEITMDATFLKG